MNGVKLNKKLLVVAFAGFLIGVLWLAAIRFVTYKSDNVHVHANFALYINGQRDNFESFTFYEEVNACSDDQDDNPKHRVHMHENVNNIVHVHDHAVTWGNFFENLGYGLTDNSVANDEEVFVDGQDGNELKFILNGEEVSDIANRAIASEDTLLVSYGKDSGDALQQKFIDINKNAGEYNTKNDPASCSGGEELTFWTRVKKAFGF